MKGIIVNMKNKISKIVRNFFFFLNFINLFNLKPVKNGYVVIAPSASLTGAPLLSLKIAERISESNNNLLIITLSGGPLLGKMKNTAKVVNLCGSRSKLLTMRLFRLLSMKGYNRYLCNSILSSIFTKEIKDTEAKVITLVHEKKNVMEKLKLFNKVDCIANNSDLIIFSSNSVLKDFDSIVTVQYKYKMLKQGLYNKSILDNFGNSEIINSAMRRELNYKDDYFIVLGIGSDWYRKGFDIFVQIAKMLEETKVKFLWIGNTKGYDNALPENIHVVNKVEPDDLYKYYYMSNLFFLSSREDPFPSVLLEAMAGGLPIIAFRGSGGAEEIVNQDNGLLTGFDAKEEIGEYLLEISSMRGRGILENIVRSNQKKIREEYNFSNYVMKLTEQFDDL